MFLSKAEWDFLTSKRQFSEDYGYTIKSRLQRKLKQFASQELPLLVEQGYLTELCKVDLTENRKVPINSKILGKDDKNINSLRAPIYENSAPSHLYAPWSGGEQCEPSSCWKEFGVSSNQKWQAASNRERKPANEKYCY